MANGYRVTNSLSDMDLDSIYAFIADSYWAKDIPRETFELSLLNSLCFGLLDEGNKQIGFARMITDKATFAYLADVFILPAYQGQGLAKQLMNEVMTHPDLQGLRKMMLTTSDAHQLYKKFGFTSLTAPSKCMEKVNPSVYQ